MTGSIGFASSLSSSVESFRTSASAFWMSRSIFGLTDFFPAESRPLSSLSTASAALSVSFARLVMDRWA